jgi:uridine phosphorylase
METKDDPAVIEPRRGARERALPPDCLLVFTPQDRELIYRCFENPPQSTHRVFLVEVAQGCWRGFDIAVAGPMMGAPQAVLTVEKLIALGVRRIIVLGWCGSLQPGVRIGDVVLPTGAISEEGTSIHYPLGEGVVPGPSERLWHGLAEALGAGGEVEGTEGTERTGRARGPGGAGKAEAAEEVQGRRAAGWQAGDDLRVHRGRVWSIDAPYRETVRKVLRYRQEGILGVDMETSALFAVARYRGIDLACVLVVSDDLSTLQWVHGFKDPRFLEARKRVVRCVLQTLEAVGGHGK